MAPDLPGRQPTAGSEGSCIEDRESEDDIKPGPQSIDYRTSGFRRRIFVHTRPSRHGQLSNDSTWKEADEMIYSRAKELEQARQRAEQHNALRSNRSLRDMRRKRVLKKKQQSWKTSCEHLAEQDVLITAKIADPKCRLSDLTRSRGKVSYHPPPTLSKQPLSATEMTSAAVAETSAVPSAVTPTLPDHSGPGAPCHPPSGAGNRNPSNEDTPCKLMHKMSDVICYHR